MKLRLFLYIALTAALFGCGVTAGCGIQVNPEGGRRLAQEHYDPETMETSLEQIRQWLAANRPGAVEALQEGLTDQEIDRKLDDGGFRFTLPNEVRVLYRWRNGMDAEFDENGWPNEFIWYHRFLSLDEALQLRKRDGLLYGMGKNWLPLFYFQEEYYYIYCEDKPTDGLPIYSRLLEDPDAMLAFTNLTTMMVTGAQWYIQGAARADGTDNHKLLLAIHTQYNPGASFPYGEP